VKLVFDRIFEFEELADIVKQTADIFSENRLVMFKGEVGAGKTTFIKSLAAHFGVLGQVDSPTFSLVNEYEGEISIFHFDLYRLKGYEELIDIGWEDYLDSKHHIWVEWPENAPQAFSEEFILVQILKTENQNERHLAIYSF